MLVNLKLGIMEFSWNLKFRVASSVLKLQVTKEIRRLNFGNARY